MTLQPTFHKIISDVEGVSTPIKSILSVGGGCINNAALVNSEKSTYFIKYNKGLDSDMFEKEARGLTLLKNTNCIQIPDVLAIGIKDGLNYLVLEPIQSGTRSHHFWEDFGNQLAELHRTESDLYGLDHHNYIGRLFQDNTESTDWISFFIHQRLEVQLQLARDSRKVDQSVIRKFEGLYPELPNLLPVEPASLLHGDLWSGNFMVSDEGDPVLIDPAVYFGNREIELAFTQLFGGFDSMFYQSYFESYPVTTGFQERADIYNLYPLLVHVNLFGQGYLSGIMSTLSRYN